MVYSHIIIFFKFDISLIGTLIVCSILNICIYSSKCVLYSLISPSSNVLIMLKINS